ncbi:hypothetical protein LTR85_004785 [Meristemomyces frigidus]|nr:hypothetical protein LTR85_004785 [Meristemomyces frigidus]
MTPEPNEAVFAISFARHTDTGTLKSVAINEMLFHPVPAPNTPDDDGARRHIAQQAENMTSLLQRQIWDSTRLGVMVRRESCEHDVTELDQLQEWIRKSKSYRVFITQPAATKAKINLQGGSYVMASNPAGLTWLDIVNALRDYAVRQGQRPGLARHTRSQKSRVSRVLKRLRVESIGLADIAILSASDIRYLAKTCSRHKPTATRACHETTPTVHSSVPTSRVQRFSETKVDYSRLVGSTRAPNASVQLERKTFGRISNSTNVTRAWSISTPRGQFAGYW